MNARASIKNLYLGLRKSFLAFCIRTDRKEKFFPASIVAIRIDRIGDLVVSLPALKALKTLFPRARLAVVAQRPALVLLEGLDWIDEKIPYRGFWKTIGVLRRKKFSLAVDLLMDYTLKTALITYLSKPEVTAGFDIAGRGRCFTIAVTPVEEKKMMYQHTLDLARGVAGFFNIEAASIPEEAPRLVLSPDSRKAGNAFLQAAGIVDGAHVCGIHPGAKFLSQCWGLEKFAQLADMISERYMARIVIIASTQEQILATKVAGLMKTRPVLAIGLALGELAAVIARMDILVCNNSGPLHIAAALGVPTVSTMGPTDPWLWYPAGPDQAVIRKELACSPCSNAVCRKHECLKLITVDQVWEKVRQRLDNTVRRP